MDPFGQKVQIFLNILLNVVDYRVASTCAGLISHKRTLSFSVCSIGRQKGAHNWDTVYSSDSDRRRL